jgi:hypothetical protein
MLVGLFALSVHISGSTIDEHSFKKTALFTMNNVLKTTFGGHNYLKYVLSNISKAFE